LAVDTEGSGTKTVVVAEAADAGSGGQVALGGGATATGIRRASGETVSGAVAVSASTALRIRSTGCTDLVDAESVSAVGVGQALDARLGRGVASGSSSTAGGVRGTKASAARASLAERAF
jgi:hypothetical protein